MIFSSDKASAAAGLGDAGAVLATGGAAFGCGLVSEAAAGLAWELAVVEAVFAAAGWGVEEATFGTAAGFGVCAGAGATLGTDELADGWLPVGAAGFATG